MLSQGNLCEVRLSPEPYLDQHCSGSQRGSWWQVISGTSHFVLICLSLAGWQSGYSESDSESDHSLPISAVGKQLCLGSVGVLDLFFT